MIGYENMNFYDSIEKLSEKFVELLVKL